MGWQEISITITRKWRGAGKVVNGCDPAILLQRQGRKGRMGDGTKCGHLSELVKEDYGASPFVLAALIIFNMPVFTFISLQE